MKCYERYRAQLRRRPLPVWDVTRLWGKRLRYGEWTYYRLDDLRGLGRLPVAERARRAECARKAYFARLAYRSAKARAR